jgi:hypothetical protein
VDGSSVGGYAGGAWGVLTDGKMDESGWIVVLCRGLPVSRRLLNKSKQ